MRSGNGFLIALCGFSVLTCGDAIIKSMADEWPIPAIAALRFAIAIPLLSAMVGILDGRTGFTLKRPWLQLGRGLALSISSVLFFLSLKLMPLAEATAIVFVSPVITAILSAIFLKEQMSRRAWAATMLALAGVAIVLRPNVAEFGAAALLPLCAAFFFSTMIILNRMAVQTGSAMGLQWILVLIAAPTVAAFALTGHFAEIPDMYIMMPDWTVFLRCACVAVTASTAHWLIFQGTMRTSAANASQAVYVQLPMALFLDALIFRHYPDAIALGGAALIIGAGLTMWMGQRVEAKIGAA
jgi:drug/metabolite transporter (DMT)-like permease